MTKIVIRDSSLQDDENASGSAQPNLHLSLDAPLVEIIRSNLNARAQGNGGHLTISTTRPNTSTGNQGLVILNDSTINALAAGRPTDVQIGQDNLYFQWSDSTVHTQKQSVPPIIDIAGSLMATPNAAVQGYANLSDTCALRLGVDVSSFVITGRGGLGPEPGGFLPDLDLRSIPFRP